MSTNVINKTSADAATNNSDDSSMNMTGALITMMGKFLSTLNQSSMIQNAMICTERSTSLDMIDNQSKMQVEEGQANATASMISGIVGIAGGVAAVGGGIAGVVGSIGSFTQLSALSNAGELEEAGMVVNLDQVSKPLVPMPEQPGDLEMDEVLPPKEPNSSDGAESVTPSDDDVDDVSSTTAEYGEDDDEEIDNDITTQQKKSEDTVTKAKMSEMDKRLKQDEIKERWARLSNTQQIFGQGFSGLCDGLGKAVASTFTTQAAAAQAAATKLSGLAQSVNSMMSSTESNYQSTMSLNTQLAGEFQQFTAWWLASSKA